MTRKNGKTDRSSFGYWVVGVAAAIAVLALGFLLLYGVLSDRNGVGRRYKRVEDLPYLEEVRAASERTGVEMARIYAVIQVESSFRADAESKSGALGLMQMLPSTYEEQCLAAGEPYDPANLKKPEVNIPVCTAYLLELYGYTGSWNWAHIAYFSGIGNVKAWQKQGLTPETVPSDKAKTYLERVKSAYEAYALMFKKADETSK